MYSLHVKNSETEAVLIRDGNALFSVEFEAEKMIRMSDVRSFIQPVEKFGLC
jgi:hypothetical protein